MVNSYCKNSPIGIFEKNKMERRFYMEFVIGIFVGALLYWVFGERKKASGTFVIDLTDPEKDVCRFEMDENLNSICMKKQIFLNVKVYENK
jgi:hypothetical protein